MKYTLQELLKLADSDEGKQQIREEVAKLCGYFQTKDQRWRRPGQTVGQCGLPEFANSRDDIARACWTLTCREWRQYIGKLKSVINRGIPGSSPLDGDDLLFGMLMSEACIRAIAFILTKQEVQP